MGMECCKLVGFSSDIIQMHFSFEVLRFFFQMKKCQKAQWMLFRWEELSRNEQCGVWV